MSDPDAEIVIKEQADLWAMLHGFSDADEMKQWGEQMERAGLTGLDITENLLNRPDAADSCQSGFGTSAIPCILEGGTPWPQMAAS